jgi:hypothetical protein
MHRYFAPSEGYKGEIQDGPCVDYYFFEQFRGEEFGSVTIECIFIAKAVATVKVTSVS